MKKIQYILGCIFIALLITGCANTGTIRGIGSAKTVSKEAVLNSMQGRPRFENNKRYTYLLAWNRIPVGRIIAEVGQIINYRGRDVYVVRLVTESNKFLSKIYRVEDTYTSYVDVETITSRRYEADRKEGNYRKHVIVEYDFETMEATYSNLTDGSVKKCVIKDNVQDTLSSICYFMTLPVYPGEKIKITINLNEKNYDLSSKIEDISTIKLPHLGEFSAFKIRPYAELGRERVEKGKAWLYFAADKRRYPLYGVVLIPFGKVTATLREVEDINKSQ